MAEPPGEFVEATMADEMTRFAEMLARCDRVVRALIRRRVSDGHAREELVQETFYRALRRLPQLHDPDRLESWVRAIARNCVADYYRRMRVPSSANGRTADEPRAGSETDNERTPGWIWEEVDRLAPHFREVLWLRYAERQSYDQIAQRLDVPVTTVRGRVYEARRHLKRRLTELGLFP
jgi:RNA polymerase sigma-70 factor (ECF subfamily)